MATTQAKLIVYLPAEIKRQIVAIAEAEDRSETSIVRTALREYLAQREARVP